MKNIDLINIFSYDTERYPFRKIIEKILKQPDLENIHNNFDFFPFRERKRVASTKFHKLFYSEYETSGFKDLYEDFIKTYLHPSWMQKL